jgi:hypothetical protein
VHRTFLKEESSTKRRHFSRITRWLSNGLINLSSSLSSERGAAIARPPSSFVLPPILSKRSLLKYSNDARHYLYRVANRVTDAINDRGNEFPDDDEEAHSQFVNDIANEASFVNMTQCAQANSV